MEDQKVALVTGCSEPNSLGAALCKLLLSKGWKVFASARKIETLKGLEEIGCDVLELDVVSKQSISDAIALLSKKTNGRLDLLINNAGVAALAPLLDMDVQRIKEMYDINVFGPIRMLHACAELLIATANNTNTNTNANQVTILNISSTARHMPPWQGAYGSSKAALANVSETMRMELAPLGVRVITANLGGVKTPMTQGQKTFPLTNASSLSGHYPNYDEVYDQLKIKMSPTTTPDSVALTLVEAIEKSNPPAIVWAGEGTVLMRYFLLKLPASLLWSIWKKIAGINDVKYLVDVNRGIEE